jgi:hypothetical protein
VAHTYYLRFADVSPCVTSLQNFVFNDSYYRSPKLAYDNTTEQPVFKDYDERLSNEVF